MAKAQASLEYLIFLGLSFVSMALIASEASVGMARVRYMLSSMELSSFVGLINQNMAFLPAHFAVYVPEWICSANVSESGIRYMGRDYMFALSLSIDAASLCNAAGRLSNATLYGSYGGLRMVLS